MPEPRETDSIISQDLDISMDDDANDLGLVESVSQTEIEDLLYSAAIPAEERLARLREMRDQLAERQVSEAGDDDSAGLLGEVQRAIDELGGSLAERDEEPDDYAPLDAALAIDPAEHIETLSPDDDERYAVEGEEKDLFASEEEAMGPGDEDLADGDGEDEGDEDEGEDLRDDR